MNQRANIPERRALTHLLDLLRVEGLSGREGDVANVVKKKLRAAGCKAGWIAHDTVHRRTPVPFEIGNLIVKLPGTVQGPRRLFMGHMDTVPLCRGAVPVRKGARIVSRGKTALGADNRTACACMVAVVEALLKKKLPHPPLTFLFCVGEEIGLLGARHVKLSDLGRPRMAFNIDSGDPREIIIGAVGADRWEVEVFGRSSHAGLHPEEGISAALIAARAIETVAAGGYFGKVVKGKRRGTSNVGRIVGGDATNQVTDYVYVKGESRSHHRRFVTEVTEAYRKAFERAARSVKNSQGRTGNVRFVAETDYPAFKLKRSEPVVRFAMQVARSIHLQPALKVVDGGLDANYMNAKGLHTVTLGAGQHDVHTVDEYADIGEYLGGCRLVLALATHAGM